MKWTTSFKKVLETPGPSLFDSPIHPVPLAQVHSEASVKAAESMRGKTESIRKMVLKLLEVRPMTDEQLVEMLEMPANTVRPRRIELYQAGLVVKAGTVIAKSGRSATLWSRKEDL